ncbi:MAG TPA: glycosyltransferase [Candidatus Binataceae bacterium]|nr:glycosyltransferase [Candidatus Binataceae bacterium]
MDISVVLPVMNEGENLSVLLPQFKAIFAREKLSYEILVIDGNSTDNTREVAAAHGARVMPERRRGYAGALTTGLAEAQGDYVLTLDADLSHEPEFVPRMWRARSRGDIVIASRYTRGGVAYSGFFRRKLSDFLNFALRRVLSLPAGDVSSGFRLYRREVVQEDLNLESQNFEIQEEILAKAYAKGFSITEVPFVYFPRGSGRSHARVLRFGIDLFTSAIKLWKIRNSLDSADYDDRAFYSIIPIQRYWQRRRHAIVLQWARGHERVLDAGCGSSVIIQSLNNAVGMDLLFPKLRFLRRHEIPLAQASAFALPFKDDSFDCLISSEVIEHVPFDDSLFTEMRRVLKADGTLILGTPDYATLGWRIIEPVYGFLIPGGYHDEHITHYTQSTLTDILQRHGFTVEESAYVGGSEMILKCRKNSLSNPLASDVECSSASSAA